MSTVLFITGLAIVTLAIGFAGFLIIDDAKRQHPTHKVKSKH